MRVRGLKYKFLFLFFCSHKVAPYAGAWIEILIFPAAWLVDYVAPYAGAWIEIQ